MRLDQIMIGEMLGEKSVGLYSVSVRFTEFFYFIPSIFMTSLFPNLVQKFSEDKNKYYMDYLRLMRLLFTLAISIGIFFTFFGDFLISYLYGNQFLAAIDSLKLSIFTGVFVFWGVAAGNMLIIEGLNRHNFIKSVQGLILNILLNFLLIPKYGINGAAFATLISQFYASYLYYLFFRKTRHIFMLQTKSILFIKLCTK
jgi:O-antigen/teichoic acid export membrane protein